MTDTTANKIAHDTSFAVLGTIGFCHLLNDMMQSLLPAIYPTLKTQFHLSFGQIGLVTLAFQCTASLFQPVVGYFADIRPMPYSLAVGMVSTLLGLVVLAVAPSYPVLLISAMMIGLGSAVFHPESSRVARLRGPGHRIAAHMQPFVQRMSSGGGWSTSSVRTARRSRRDRSWICPMPINSRTATCLPRAAVPTCSPTGTTHRTCSNTADG